MKITSPKIRHQTGVTKFFDFQASPSAKSRLRSCFQTFRRIFCLTSVISYSNNTKRYHLKNYHWRWTIYCSKRLKYAFNYCKGCMVFKKNWI